MRNLVLALLLVATASTAFAGPIIDIQTGMYPEDTLVNFDGVVTAVRDNGFFVGEYAPAPYAGIWVYTGTGNHSLVVGEIVDVVGIYKEYYDLTEVDVPAAEADGQAVGGGMWTGDLVPLEVSATVYAADPEPYEGCYIKITDGMMVFEAPNSYGEWTAESMDAAGMFVIFDDFFFDPSALAVGDCFDGATGCLNYSFGNYLFEVFADGLTIGDCTVATDDMNFDSLKAIYR